tara:strand:+ start:5513 stop:7888 length:2376 start_codon:yes stop_codon:yes gene_type:complete
MKFYSTLTALLLSSFVYSQTTVGDWESYTSFLDVKEVVSTGGDIYCATTGGLLKFNLLNQSFETFTNIDGLQETDISTISFDKEGFLWIGGESPEGIIQIYDVNTKNSVKIFHQLEVNKISDIAVSDSLIFLSYQDDLDWRIYKFIWRDDEHWEAGFYYSENYNPSSTRLENIYSVEIFNDILFAATDLGLFTGDINQDILNYPENWTLLLPSNVVKNLYITGDSLFIVHNNGEIWVYDGNYSLFSDYYSTNVLVDVAVQNESVFAVTTNSLVKFNNDGDVIESWNINQRPQDVVSLTDGNIAVATDGGLLIIDSQTGEKNWHIPNCPMTNVYTALTVLPDGRLVAAGKKGVSILNDKGWYNITANTSVTPSFQEYTDDDYFSFISDTAQFKGNRVWSLVQLDDRIVFSIQGANSDTNETGQVISGGIVSIDPDNPSDYVVYDTSNGQLNPFNNDGYLNIRGLQTDSNDNLWISNFGADDNDKKITVMTQWVEWFHIPQIGIDGSKLDNPTEIIVTDEDVAIVASNIDNGLFLFDFIRNNDADSVLAIEPVEWWLFTEGESGDGLASKTIWSLVETDPRTVWVLTANGVQQLNFSSNYRIMTPYFFTFFAGVPFGEGSKLNVDGRENLWISSISDGLYVLQSNSTPWPDWGGFQHDNSFLLSDEVTAVAFDNEKGLAYIATSKGINTLKMPFSEPITSYKTLITYPSPYRIPSSSPMVIDGLMDNSSIKIMTLSGRLLRDIPSSSSGVQGYQAFWDGRTDSGEYVGTGIYLVAVYNGSGENTVTKVAVIRE